MFNIDEIRKRFFENSGSRIKKFAVICFFINFILVLIGAVIFVFAGLINIDDGGAVAIFLAPIGVIVYTFIAWVSTIFIFGFGELIENTKNTKPSNNDKNNNDKNNNKTIAKNNNPLQKEVLPPLNVPKNFIPCPVCGANTSQDKTFCHVCGEYISTT